MKKILICTVIIFGSFALTTRSEAQLRVGVNLNIGSQPDWGPVGYDNVQYYYLPDIDAYYYVPNRQFIYLSGGRWVFSGSLPWQYRDYDLYRGYKVVLNEPNAYLHYNLHRRRYAGFRGNHSQVIIRNSKDERYRDNSWTDRNGRDRKDRDDHDRDKNHKRRNDH